jgi:glycosyltransferase involved in cell wall biosynthesis
MSSNSNVRVSYVITTKNRAAYLDRVLTNVREFIEPIDELVIIDGGSTDATGEVVARNQDIVTVFVSEPDEGEAHAFNKALFRARGRYIKPITDDDYFYPDAMRRLVAEMETNPDVDAIHAGGELWDQRNASEQFIDYWFLDKSAPPTTAQIFDKLVCGLGLIVRRDVLERTGGVSNAHKAVDGDLLCRLIECNCKVRYLDVNSYKRYLYPHSGCTNLDNMERDRLIFWLRMGRWEEFLTADPDRLWLLFGGGSTRRHALFCGLWMASSINRSPLWWVPVALRNLVKRMRRTQRAIRQRSPKVIRSRSHEWSGELR